MILVVMMKKKEKNLGSYSEQISAMTGTGFLIRIKICRCLMILWDIGVLLHYRLFRLSQVQTLVEVCLVRLSLCSKTYLAAILMPAV